MYYPTTNGKLFAFNVNTRTNTEIDVGGKVWNVASLTGIDCGVNVLFKSGDNCTYAWNMDNTVTQVGEKQDNALTAFFPSKSNPKSVKNSVFLYDSCLVKNGKVIHSNYMVGFYENSTIRVYKDIFLTYDDNIESWVLVRIIVP